MKDHKYPEEIKAEAINHLLRGAIMNFIESAQAVREMNESHDAEVKARLELLRKIHCPPHSIVDFERSLADMGKRNIKLWDE